MFRHRLQFNIHRVFSSNSKSPSFFLKSIIRSSSNPKHVELQYADGSISHLTSTYLRDHCPCPRCTHPITKQRQFDTYHITSTTRNELIHEMIPSQDGQSFTITWKEQDKTQMPSFLHHPAKSTFTIEDILPANSKMSKNKNSAKKSDIILPWKNNVQLPAIAFADFMEDSEIEKQGMMQYKNTGLLLLSKTPSCMSTTKEFAERMGNYVLPTLYGGMWTTSPACEEESYNDTAASNEALLPHTDCSYYREPPGVQIFNCTAQSSVGGESVFVDGMAILKALPKETIAYFTKTNIDFQCIDTDYLLETSAKMLSVDENGNLDVMRHNDSDRAPLTYMSAEEQDTFYHHHSILSKVVRDPELTLTLKLQVGDMVVCNNQRVLHGRNAFPEGESRALIGCYLTRDAVESRLRILQLM